MQLLKNFSIRQQLMGIVIACMIPFFIMTAIIIKEKNHSIDITEKEWQGTQYLRPLISLLGKVADYKMNRISFLAGEDVVSELKENEAQVDKYIAELIKINKELGKDLQVTPEGMKLHKRDFDPIVTIEKNWQIIKSSNKLENIAFVSLLKSIKGTIDYVGDTSGLILDPELDSYYMLVTAVKSLPESLKRQYDIISLIYPKLLSGVDLYEHDKKQMESFLRISQEQDIDVI